MKSSRSRAVIRIIAGLGLALLLVAGCSSSGTSGPSVASGGSIVIGAEQEPDCMDWVGSCSTSAWGFWMANVTTMPRAFNVRRDGDSYAYVRSELLSEEPELETAPVQRITYRIDPKAIWNDGTPITSADFAYTWDQIKNGADIRDRTGYRDIASVDATDASTAVVTFAPGASYASWKALFGGAYGILPAHLLEGRDRAAAMGAGYSFSGGPWEIDRWERGVSIVLKPNDAYWGTRPKLDQVTFTFTPDTASEFEKLAAGEVSMIYPQPQLDVVEQLAARPAGVRSEITSTTSNVEAMWMNNSVPPFDDVAVRRAICRSVDRDAVVSSLFGSLGVTAAWNSFDPPVLSEVTDTAAFAGCTKDLSEVSRILEADGWTKGADGIWVKDGRRLEFTLRTTSSNARRALTAKALQSQLADAGIAMSIETEKSTTLFGQTLPNGDFQMVLYAKVARGLDPVGCAVFCSANIPSPANNNSGQNLTRADVPAADPLLASVDTALDPSTRVRANREAMRLLAADVVSIPLDPLPNILLWSERIVGPVSDNGLEGPFWNMEQWGLQK